MGGNPFGIGLENPRDGTGIPASDILNYPPDIHGMVTVGEEME
jgi:hypothetical protein